MKKSFKPLLILGAVFLLGLAGCDETNSSLTSSEPGTSDSGTSDPGTSDPGTSDPGTSDPGTSDPGTSDPGTSDPGTSDPGTSDPGTSDPGTSDPGTSDPGTSDPGTSDPGTSDPGTPDTPTPDLPTATTAKKKTTLTPNVKLTTSADTMYYTHVFETFNVEGKVDVNQIEYVMDINFGGMDVNNQWYGGAFGVGSNGVNRVEGIWSDASGFWSYADSDTQADGAYAKGTLSVWFDVDYLDGAESVFFHVTHMAKDTFDITLKEVNFYHSQGYGETNTVVNSNTVLIQNYEHKNKATVALSSLNAANPISYIDLNLAYTSAAAYAGGVVWVEGVFEEGLALPNVPRNNVNIGIAMTPGDGTTTNASVRIYLENYVAVDPTGYINFQSFWAPAHNVTLKSVTFYQITGSSSSDSPTPDVNLSDTFLSELNSPLEEKLGIDKIKTAMANSLVNQGNNYLLKNAVSKMESGATTTIAAIGGSITEGDQIYNGVNKSWAYWTYKFLADKYGNGSNVKFQNAGMSGTGSDIGVARFKTDVLDFNPSIVFIEFAVNNGETQFEKETYESMIRMALNHSSKPAVVLTMSWTTYSGGNTEKYMTDLGKSYNLPVISIHKGLNAYKGQIFAYDHANPNECFAGPDNTHPTENGHKLYAKLVGYGITTIAAKSQDSAVSMPSAKYSDRYETMSLYQRGNSAVKVTGFDTSSQTYVSPTEKNTYQKSGQGGWKLASGTGTLKMTIKAKAVIVLYCANQYDGSHGTINVTVSGGHTASVSRDHTFDNRNQKGWGQICPVSVLAADEAKECTITLSFTGKGQIIGIGVAQ